MARSSLTSLRSSRPAYASDGHLASCIRDMIPLRDRRAVPRPRKDNSIFNYFFIFALTFRNAFVTADCGNMQVLETGGFSCSLIKEILSAHNELRQKVAEGLVKDQPIASGMRELYWDEELANGAQDWANQCTFAHNEEKDREVARFQVGQNLARTKSKRERPSTEKEFRKQITNWFEEHERFKFGPILKLEDLQAFGHYTQLIWADTYLVGCGYSRYRSSNNITYRLYVCHYGPTGNELEKAPYERENQECSKDLIQSEKYPKLCSLKKSPPNPCSAIGEEKDTHVQDDTKDVTVAPDFRDGRRFFSGLPKEIQTVDDRDEKSKEKHFAVMQKANNLILNMFFNFW